MKFLTILTALFLALFTNMVYTAAVDTGLTAREQKVSTPYGDVVAYELPDGRRKLDFYTNGALEGSAIETDDGATFLDLNGVEIDLNDESIEKRQSKFKLAIRFAKLVAKWGKRAWDYIYCVGASSIWRCGDDYIQCATQGTPPWLCLEGIVCVGSAARGC